MKKLLSKNILIIAIIVSLIFGVSIISNGDTDTSLDNNKTPFLVTAQMSGSWYVKLSWTKVDDATKYVVYGNKSGKTAKKLATRTKNQKTYTVKQIKSSYLLAHTPYRFYVVAYNGTKN